jgi:hypothetical protein
MKSGTGAGEMTQWFPEFVKVREAMKADNTEIVARIRDNVTELDATMNLVVPAH